MKTTKIAWLCFAAIAITACKKENAGQNVPLTGNSPVNMQKIEQKPIEISQEKTLAMVLKFKSDAAAHEGRANARLVRDSIPVDSSIFVLEAALNYDFDAAADSAYDPGTDSTQVSLRYNSQSGKIAPGDLEGAYEQLTNAVVAIGRANGGVKVRAIDIEAFVVDDRTIQLKAKVLQILSFSRNPCIYSSTANASPYWQYYMAVYAGSGTPPVPPRPDAVTILNGLLNCQQLRACVTGESVYYTNLVTITKSSISTNAPQYGVNPTNPNPSALFSSPWMTQQAMYTTYVALTPSQINNYRSGCNALISSSTPSGKVNIHNQIMQFSSSDQSISPPKWCVYWKMNILYGTNAGCRILPSR